MEYLSAILVTLLAQAPSLLVWIIGIIVAIIFWRKHPKVSALTLIAISGFILIDILNIYINFNLPTLLEHEWGFLNASNVFLFRGIIYSILSAIFWTLVIIAIFGWRKKD